MSDVLLGFEVGTGEPVNIPITHTIVTGITQAAGKLAEMGFLTKEGGGYQAVPAAKKRIRQA